ncbi:hypothetical protein HSBAA_47570 [Vreelandella sulfidaeris]|uniref:Phospholipase/carboxylesterase/thioesterase domain-containing protein n=1 Tax=Vreelandella sulfidaeris TaxID=115553 RepID=A0A455UFJ8_9GAMM|nr:hypothetical protein HSBAA_47570 [Halomonas sulfidaeris]
MTAPGELVIEPKDGQPADACVFIIHGLGADGHDFEPLVPALALPKEAHVRFIMPHAPRLPVTINGGMVMPAWYDILAMDLGRRVDENQLKKSAERIQALIQEQIDQGIDSQRIIVAGFSQGGAVAYQAALTFPAPLGACWPCRRTSPRQTILISRKPIARSRWKSSTVTLTPSCLRAWVAAAPIV